MLAWSSVRCCIFRLEIPLTKLRIISWTKMDEIVEIDGSMQEGGGQLVRFSVAIGALVKRPVRIFNIRGGRNKPGLSAQHLKGLELVRDISHGQLKGAAMGSTEITFVPGDLKSGAYTVDTGTAGSVALLLQIALPCLLFADGESSLLLKGGTDADFAPPIDYTLQVFNWTMEKFGIKYDLEVVKRGYYPRGGGIVTAKLKPLTTEIPPIVITERGHVTQIVGRSFVAGNVNMSASHQMAEGAISYIKNIKQYKDISIAIERVKESPQIATGNMSGIMLLADTNTGCRFAGTALYKRNLRSEDTGIEAAEMLLSNLNHGGCVDDHLQDQLILFMALAKGKSKIKCGPITSHTNTVITLAQLLTKVEFKISPDEQSSSSFFIECEGIGFTK